MKKLLRKRKHLEIFFGNFASLEDSQHLPQGPPGKADNNVNTLELCFTYGQANNPALYKAEIKTTNKIH